MKAKNDEPVTITIDEVVRSTGDATLVKIDKREVRIPHSQMLEPDDPDDIEGEITIPQWLAEDRELV